MLEKMFIKTLQNLSQEEKEIVRNALIGEPVEKDSENAIVEEKDKDENNEEAKGELKEELNDQKDDNEEEKDGDKEEIKEDVKEENTLPQDEVQEVIDIQEGIRVEDLVTKEELLEKLSAMDAKLNAVIKENEDLKDKYENHDFGNMQKKGMDVKDNPRVYESYDEYCKKFQ